MADFSVGIEEEFFIVDPSTRALAPGYMDLFAASENAGSDAIELKEELVSYLKTKFLESNGRLV